MAQNKQVIPYNTFVGGLVTEATELTFPPNASFDELNTVLSSKGNRRRRLGLNHETDFTLSTFSVATADLPETAIARHTWSSVGGDGFRTYEVFQIGSKLYFYDLSVLPLSSGEKSFNVNLATYKIAGSGVITNDVCAFASGRGDLFVVGPHIDPLRVQYTASTDAISVEVITVKVRDFEGLDDDLDVDEQPTSLSNEHKYNLYNQGWYIRPDGTDNAERLYAGTGSNNAGGGAWPANNQQWHLAVYPTTASAANRGNVDAQLLNRLSVGSAPAPKGHYILDAFDKDRSGVSGVGSFTKETKTTRPEAISFFAGRVAYAHNSTVYISELLNDDRSNAGKCHQDADPTAEDISDLVDTDGLTIQVPEADSIQIMVVMGSSLILFARNGVWAVTAETGFKSTEFAIRKITAVSTVAKNSVVTAEGVTLWWADTGIFVLQQEEVSQLPTAISITDQTIKTFYNEITSALKQNAIGTYNPTDKTVVWLYGEDTTTSNHKYTKALVYNILLKAFVPWTFGVLATTPPFVCSAFKTPSLSNLTETIDVLNSTGDSVVNSTGDQVIVSLPTVGGEAISIQYLCTYASGSNTYFTFGNFSNRTFTDWEKYAILELGASVGIDYESYVETGYELAGDLVRKKQAPYIVTHLKRTETGYVIAGDDAYYINPSSCFLRVKWEWSDSAVSGRWSTNEQVYRLRTSVIPEATTFEYTTGFSVVTSRTRIRGSGRAIQLRYESESGKDFDLLGWGIIFTGNTEP